MNILFASTHGSLATELSILTKNIGARLFLTTSNSAIIPTATKPHEKQYFEKLGAIFIEDDDDLSKKLDYQFFDTIVIAVPQQLMNISKTKTPIIAMTGTSSIWEFKDIKNVMCPSQKALDMLDPNCNKMLYPKLLNWEVMPKDTHSYNRYGFSSFINCYDTLWQYSKTKFDEIKKMLPETKIEWYGSGSKKGIVDDLRVMRKSKATIHIKDKGMCCNAPIRSMGTGTPVLMDQETYDKGYFDSIEGIIVRNSLEELRSEIEKIDRDEDYLEDLSESAYFSAKRQFSCSSSHATNFKMFLGRLR